MVYSPKWDQFHHFFAILWSLFYIWNFCWNYYWKILKSALKLYVISVSLQRDKYWSVQKTSQIEDLESKLTSASSQIARLEAENIFNLSKIQNLNSADNRRETIANRRVSLMPQNVGSAAANYHSDFDKLRAERELAAKEAALAERTAELR